MTFSWNSILSFDAGSFWELILFLDSFLFFKEFFFGSLMGLIYFIIPNISSSLFLIFFSFRFIFAATGGCDIAAS